MKWLYGILQAVIGSLLDFWWKKKEESHEAVRMADSRDTLDDGERL